MYQKYLYSSSGEPTWWKYNGKSGCESNLLVRFNYTADPRDQRPKSQSTNLTVCSQTPKEETQNLPLEVSARLNGGVAQHGQWSLWTQPLLCSHPLSSQKHAWFTTENFLGHLCIPETGSGQMRGEDSEKDTCLLGASQITKDLKPLILWIWRIVSKYVNGERRSTGTS